MNKLSNLGIGYVSVMMVFAVICLTILAVLSFQTADSGSALTERNAEYTQQYYEADSKAKHTLMQLDYAAAAALESGFFEDTFPELISDIDEVTCSPVPGGFAVKFTTELNDRLTLCAGAKFFSAPAKGGSRYEITEWKTASTGTEDNGPSLWDGEF